MRKFLLPILASASLSLAWLGSASANNIATFSQTSDANTLVATVNAGDTQTTLTVAGAGVNISQFAGGGAPLAAFFSLAATSIDAATTVAGAVLQHFDGTFCLSSIAGCGGTNYLSGTFSDAAFGALGGPGLVVNASNPPDALTLLSDVIGSDLLDPPSALSLGFTNVTSALAIIGNTIGPMTASLAGTVSASQVFEPSTLFLLGVGLVLLGLNRWLPGRWEGWAA